MKEYSANSFFQSKKAWVTLAGKIAVVIYGYLAANDPNVHHQMIYGITGAVFAALGISYVQGESRIDAAAVRPAAPDTVVTQNVEPVVKPDQPTYSG